MRWFFTPSARCFPCHPNLKGFLALSTLESLAFTFLKIKASGSHLLLQPFYVPSHPLPSLSASPVPSPQLDVPRAETGALRQGKLHTEVPCTVLGSHLLSMAPWRKHVYRATARNGGGLPAGKGGRTSSFLFRLLGGGLSLPLCLRCRSLNVSLRDERSCVCSVHSLYFVTLTCWKLPVVVFMLPFPSFCLKAVFLITVVWGYPPVRATISVFHQLEFPMH